MRILVLEDSQAVARLVENGLKAEGYSVTLATTLAQAHDLLGDSEFDGMVLDRWVPDGDGLSLVAHLRAHGDETPIIMLTTMDKNDQRIEGLRTGADDYLGKPFTMEELALRLHKLLGRRARTTLLEAGPIKIDPLGHRTWVRDEEIELTAKEFDLVSLLLSNQGRVLTTAQLLQRVWGLQHDPGTNRVAVYINRVRTKIGPGLIHTVRSIGYVFDPNR